MKLAVSNIAWTAEASPKIIPKLADQGVESLVIAPTMVWPDGSPDKRRAEAYATYIADQGLTISGMQSLTYGLEGAALFGSPAEQRRLSEHLKRRLELAGQLGVSAVVFGSPGLRGTATAGDIPSSVIRVFGAAASAANDYGTQLAIEPLHGYGNRFITSTDEGIDLVQRVNHPGLGLHLDSAAVAAAGEDPLTAVSRADHSVGIASFDASAPDLAAVSLADGINHAGFGEALHRAGYEGTVSLEMRGPQSPDQLFEALAFVRRAYAIGRDTIGA